QCGHDPLTGARVASQVRDARLCDAPVRAGLDHRFHRGPDHHLDQARRRRRHRLLQPLRLAEPLVLVVPAVVRAAAGSEPAHRWLHSLLPHRPGLVRLQDDQGMDATERGSRDPLSAGTERDARPAPATAPRLDRRRLLLAGAALLPAACAAPVPMLPPPAVAPPLPRVSLGQRWRYETVDLYRGAVVGELRAQVTSVD